MLSSCAAVHSLAKSLNAITINDTSRSLCLSTVDQPIPHPAHTSRVSTTAIRASMGPALGTPALNPIIAFMFEPAGLDILVDWPHGRVDWANCGVAATSGLPPHTDYLSTRSYNTSGCVIDVIDSHSLGLVGARLKVRGGAGQLDRASCTPHPDKLVRPLCSRPPHITAHHTVQPSVPN